MECLDPIVTSICKRHSSLRACAGHPASECPAGASDFRQQVVGAVYLAFVALGGKPEAPGAFSWLPRNVDRIRETAVRQLHADLTGPGSNFGDFMRRMQPRRRREVALCNSHRWHAWEYGVAEDPVEIETHQAKRRRGVLAVVRGRQFRRHAQVLRH